MRASIIIPAYNEAENIGALIRYLIRHGNSNLAEIIVIDGGSTDSTMMLAEGAGALAVRSPQKGRAAQMNYGASLAQGELLYFVHADTIPPETYLSDILTATAEGAEMGRYLSRYVSKSWLLRLNELLSRIDTFAAMGGDQTLFITRNLFQSTGGFDTRMNIMEEFEFCARARKYGKYRIINKPVLISARKYDNNGWLQVQRANYTVVKMYQKGASPESMMNKYKDMLDHR
ncbi:MAG: TIGR04283 family arsenosugar biosynthesis glycosyltransferase [Daejeonella sp.]